MEAFVKIVGLNSEVEAELAASVLSDRGIPHLMRSYRDSALDGLFQGPHGWGHIEAAESSRSEIVAVIEEIKRQARGAENRE